MSSRTFPESCPPKYAPTGDLRTPPWVEGVVGDISGTKTATSDPENRRVVVDTNWLSYHNPAKMGSLHDFIVTTEAIAREYGASGCTKCYGGGIQYDFNYVEDGEVLP